MFSVFVNVDGAVRKLDTIAENARDLEPPLKDFGEHLKDRALERFRAQDFEPLARGTIQHRVQKGLRSLERKLERDVGKAVKRQKRAPKGLVARAAAAMGFVPAGDLAAAPYSRGARNRMAVLDEFRRQHRRGSSQMMAGGSPLTLKQQMSLGKRVDRAVAKAVTKPILGRIVETLVVEAAPASVLIEERTRTHFTEIHNKGGPAGHGAKLPPRPTLFIEEGDLEVAKSLILEHLRPDDA